MIILLYISFTQAIDCGPLSSPANGDVSVNPDTAFGSTATYSCRRGFLLLGNRLRRCQADGQWSNSEPTCQSKPNSIIIVN